jgi:hypothetical protein
MRRIQKVVPKNLSPTIAKPFARKKYDFRVEEVVPPKWDRNYQHATRKYWRG